MARAMKDSGIDWLGEIPADWEISKVKHYYKMQTGFTPDTKKEEFYDDVNGHDWVNISDIHDGKIITETKKKISQLYIDNFFPVQIPAGSLLYSFKLSVGQTAFAGKPLYSNEAIASFLPSENINLHFLRYSSLMIEENAAVNIYNARILNRERINNAYIIFPPLDEQQRIAAFLDGECARIDSVVEKTRASIEEYRKLKQAIITRAVTKGIRPNRATKDSGIDWIGQIPADWKVCKLKHSIEWKSEKGQPNAVVLSLYRDYGVIPKNSRDDNHNVTSLDTSTYKVVSKGDFVINKMKAWQGSMAVSDYDGIVSPAYHVCKIIDSQIVLKYLHYLLRNQLYLPEYKRLSTGMRIGQWDLSFEDFKNLPFILSSQDEQKEIAAYLDEKTAVIDSLVAKKNRLVSELESLKKSLIFEYVTGKKEVPK